jgi:sterol 3beta-glucosyltransferase
LYAGKPTVVVPFIVDQLFWGKRIQALGAGPEPIAAKQLTSVRLAHAIQCAISDPAMRRQAEALGNTIRAEHGLHHAVRIIGEYLNKVQAADAASIA